jgi:hypothetical protein
LNTTHRGSGLGEASLSSKILGRNRFYMKLVRFKNESVNAKTPYLADIESSTSMDEIGE